MSSSVCSDHHHHHHHQQLFPSSKKTLLLRDIDIPPRKLLLTRRAHQDPAAEMYSISPRFSSAEETLLQKFLPFNNSSAENDDDDSDDPYSSDHFRMYEFKIRRCTRSRSHDWTDCPFVHPGEKARRRDPRRHHYSGTVCPEYRRGGCSRGDSCEFAHGVFECWLHPARYRTEACKDGKNCKRKVCFFAHTPRQLRVLPPSLHSQTSSPEISPVGYKNKYLSHLSPTAAAAAAAGSNHCCMFCCHSVTSSPTSTLLGMSHLSPPLSPPLSPAAKHGGFSPVSRYGLDRMHHGGGGVNVSYKDVLTDLMCSLEAMNFSETSPVSSATNYHQNLPWIDVSFNKDDQQQQFILSPSTPNPSGPGNFFDGDCSSSNKSFNNNNIDHKQLNVNNSGSCSDPDLGWVNELLM
ncbi:hypothetical protein FEM48_Zijuj04G0125300 [Ziziphus jujuba var. spinosa]|uniref:C3H1-type domain-containing protein n=1 Tax=Ziziphus jujuba var. spinosa TaxID=714518 RepID=A0A978VJW7_ZIZJJ|nr:hypothetical protein FEM48_Zijuj04G0125300 [Ziziphus jujuba var. spinosa]